MRDSNVMFVPDPMEGWPSPLLLIADSIKPRVVFGGTDSSCQIRTK